MELNKIHNGDCFELMKDIESNSIDLVLTDVPYGMSFQSNHRKEKHKKISNDDNLDWLPDSRTTNTELLSISLLVRSSQCPGSTSPST